MQASNRASRSETVESLFRQYGNDIYRYVKYSVPQDVDPADVVQEVFVRAFRGWDGFQAQSSPKTWLFTIARNYVYDLLRKKQNERRYLASQYTDERTNSAQLESLFEIEDALLRLNPDDQASLKFASDTGFIRYR